MAINVLMTLDKNYISQARVTIWSARKYTDVKTELIFTMLHSDDLGQSYKDRILVLEDKWKNLSIRFYNVNEHDFSNVEGKGHISVAAYYRLLAANILEVDKCIYLDCDLIVYLDLNDLFKIDISDYYIGGVADMGLISSPNSAFQYMQDCNIKDFSDYINTGVLLMNLELMRKEHLVERFFSDMVQGNNPWLDQDVINRVCHGKIRLLDWTFNHMAGYSNEEYMWQYGKSKREEKGKIYHWAGKNKAWNNYSFWRAWLWWGIAKEALEPDVYQEYYQVADRHMRQAFFSEIADNCKGKNEIVIVGFSDYGIQVMRYLRKCGITGKILFCDNDKRKRGIHSIGNIVLSVEEAAYRYKNALWINAIQNMKDEINDQIKELGIPANQILEYYAMHSDDYLSLAPEYMQKGLEEKMYLHK